MRWIKAKDNLPASEWRGPVRFDYKNGNWTHGIRNGLHMEYASGIYEDLEWLDESLPASAVEEAARMYPYLTDDKPYLEQVRQAHITCAGMYTGEIERLKDVLHIDQTGLAAGLARVNQIVEGYRWVTEGRGPYAWNDDKYKEEMGNMLDNISEAATKALISSGAIAHSVCCGKEGRTATMEGIGYIKQDAHDKEIETLKAENSKMRKALNNISNPIEYLRKYAESQGGQLDGSGAAALSNDPAFLKSIATEALKTT